MRMLSGVFAALFLAGGLAANAAEKPEKTDKTEKPDPKAAAKADPAAKPTTRISLTEPERLDDADWKELEKANIDFVRKNRDALEYLPADVVKNLALAVKANPALSALAGSPLMMAALGARLIKPAAVGGLPRDKQAEMVKACAPDVLPEELAALYVRLDLNYRNATEQALLRALEGQLKAVKAETEKQAKIDDRRRAEEEREKQHKRDEKKADKKSQILRPTLSGNKTSNPLLSQRLVE